MTYHAMFITDNISELLKCERSFYAEVANSVTGGMLSGANDAEMVLLETCSARILAPGILS